jgi:hypothetical protein
MRRDLTNQAPATTRRSSLPSGASARGCDTGRDRPQAPGLRSRPSPARGIASRCRAGASRWAIRWAKPSRIGPYQAQRLALTGAGIWPDLQVFRRVEAPRTPCFTRERPLVRNQPRPSKRCHLAGTFAVRSPEPRLAGATACLVAPSFRTRVASRLARERSRRASSRLTCERSLVRAQPPRY